MSELYTRRGSLSIKKETTAGTPVTPDTYVPFNSEDISTEYPYMPAIPISSNRSLNMRAIDGAIPAPTGSINLNIEPDTFPNFLLGVFGGVTSGVYLKISSIVGTFNTTGALTFSPSSATADVDYVGDDFLLISGVSGTPTTSDSITQAGSGATADVDEYNATVYGHAGSLPANIGNGHTFSIQFNYVDSAIRYYGVRFTGFDAIGQSDNILTANVQVMAQGAFRCARVTAVTTAGAGAKTITVDQTKGLVASDTVKLYRPSTGAFLDFSAASTKTHTVGTVPTATTFTVTNLETSTAVGDLIVLAPQTASYSIDQEFAWIGGSEIYTDAATSGTYATEKVEDFSISVLNEYEARHAAQGSNYEDRYPAAILQKGLRGNGTFKLYYQDEDYIRLMRQNTAMALKLITEGTQIGSTGYEHELRIYCHQVQLDSYDTPMDVDKLMDEEIPFTMFYDSTEANMVEFLVINDTSSY